MLPWILLGLGAILLILFIAWYIVKRKKQQPILQFKPKIVLLPHETALQELEKLRIKKLWQSGKIKEYHSELTEILRKYIEAKKLLESNIGTGVFKAASNGPNGTPVYYEVSK